MAFFNSKKTAAETPIPEVMEEHKQSIGNQVMEALGVGEPAAADKAKEDEEFEIMMPMKKQQQLAVEEMARQHENVCVISKDTVIKGSIEVQGTIVVAGTVKGNISAASVACANDTCSIEGDIVCDELEMHSGKIKGNIIASNKAIINGNVEGNIDCQSSVETSFGEHAVVNGQYIRCGVLKVEPGAQIAATIEMHMNQPVKHPIRFNTPAVQPNAFATRYRSDDNKFGKDYIQNAGTAAIRKALGNCGFGTPANAEYIEGITPLFTAVDDEDAPVDSGVPTRIPVPPIPKEYQNQTPVMVEDMGCRCGKNNTGKRHERKKRKRIRHMGSFNLCIFENRTTVG